MKGTRAAVAAVLSLALGAFGFTAFAPTASAHVPSATTTCVGLTVDLVNYQTKPGTSAVPENLTPNHVTVTVNAAVKADTDFGTSYNRTFPFLPNQANTYKVVVTAWDGPNNPIWSQTFTNTVEGCVVLVPATMNLTYMTACAPDDTNTWRIRNGSTFPVPFTLEYAGLGVQKTGIAPIGDWFVNLPRTTATAILKWGGGNSGIISGSVTKASGKDEVSDTCAGDKPADKVITKDVGAPDCGATTVKTEITTSTFALEGNKWIEQAPVITYGTRTLTSEEMVLFQNTNPGGKCYVVPPTKDATTVVTDTKWGCGDLITKTTSVTTTYTFEFDSVNGSYGPPIAHVGEPVIGSRDLSTEEILLYQNTDSKGLCYVKPMIKDATTVVTTAKWVCNDKTAVTSSVTTTYSFAFDSKTGTYGPAIATAGAPVAGVRDLTAAEFVACPVVPVTPQAPQEVLASTGANDVTPLGVGAGLLALLFGAGLLIARKKA